MSIIKTNEIILADGLNIKKTALDSYKFNRTNASNVITEEIIIDPDSVRIPRLDSVGSLKQVIGITADTTLNSSHVGKMIAAGSATNISVTLPAANTLPSGSKIEIYIYNGTLSITIPSGILATSGNINLGLSVNNLPSGNIVLISEGAGNIWEIQGTSLFKYLPSFTSQLTQNGYQKLPSGLIMQWVYWINPSAYNVGTFHTVPLNIPMPNSILHAQATQLNSSPSVGGIISIRPTVSKNSIDVTFTENRGATSLGIYFQIIGH